MEPMVMMAKAILSETLGKAPEVESLTQLRDALNRVVDCWNSWMLWGLAFAAIAALWVGIATRMVIFRSKQLAEAQSRLDSAKEAELRFQLAEAKELTAQADLKRMKLQNRIVDIFGPRQLTPAQSVETTEKLLGLTGVQVDVLVLDFADARDSAEFKDSVSMGRSIQDTLKAANLDVEGWIADSCLDGTWAQGLNVAVHFDAATVDESIAGKILAAFPPALRFVNKVEHWEAAPFCKTYSDLATTGRSNKRKPGTAKIMVIIGPKTQPLLTREMLEPDDEHSNP
jgi:hypothetical protein